MTKHYDQMAEQEKVEWAAWFMGWFKQVCQKTGEMKWTNEIKEEWVRGHDCFCTIPFSTGFKVFADSSWNPLKSRDDLQMVLDKVVEGDSRDRFCEEIAIGSCLADYEPTLASLIATFELCQDTDQILRAVYLSSLV